MVTSKVTVQNKGKGGAKVVLKDGVVDAYVDFQLRTHQMELKKGNVYAVKGAFGAGKSLFMKSLVHLLNSNYECLISGKVGYV